MGSLISWLHTATDHPVLIAAEAHLRLVTIHPFVDGNGRTARLLMKAVEESLDIYLRMTEPGSGSSIHR